MNTRSLAGGMRRLWMPALGLLTVWILGGAGCAERRTPVEIQAHSNAWSDPASEDFHGLRVLRATPSGCVACHGADLEGLPGAPSCTDCHAGSGGHPGGWAIAGADHFHGDDVATHGNASCRACHGADARGGWSDVSCFDCHAGGPSGHPDGWMNPVASSFHGLRVRQQGVDACTRCHGSGLSGGTSGVACARCHG